MELSSLIELFLGSEIEKFLSNRKDLEVGDKLQGKVIEIKDDGKALIDFLKFRTVAKVKFPVKVGEKISVTVVEKGENLKFSLDNKNSSISIKSKEIINSIKNQDVGEIKKFVSSLKDFAVESQSKNNGPKEVPIEKSNLSKTGIEKNIMVKGLKNKVIVKGLENKVMVKGVENKAKSTEILNASKMEDIPEKIKNIIKVLEIQFKPFGPAEDILKISSRLKTQIENSGIFFEKKIAEILSKIGDVSDLINSKVKGANNPEIKSIIQNDLKPNLLLLKEFFSDDMKEVSGKNRQINTIRETIDELINNIGKQQDGAVKRNLNIDTMQYFTFHIPIKDKKKAKLRVYYNKNEKRKSSSKGFNLSLLLVMDNLGEIRTDFLLLKKNLNITFFVMNEDIKKIIADKLNIVRESLDDTFRFLNINVVISKRKIREFDNEEITGEEIKLGLVDLSV